MRFIFEWSVWAVVFEVVLFIGLLKGKKKNIDLRGVDILNKFFMKFTWYVQSLSKTDTVLFIQKTYKVPAKQAIEHSL